MLIAGYLLSVVIGISLGLIGGGGSILTVPILVYLFGISATLATGYSLFIVGITSFVGAVRYYSAGFVNLKRAFLFAIPSLISLILARQFLMPVIPPVVFSTGTYTLTKDMLIMIVFSVFMIAASFSMIRTRAEPFQGLADDPVGMIAIGFCVGVLTGFLGAGGGFLIVPSLIFFAGLDMKQSVGTSLFIIAFNSLFGFANDVLHGEHFNYVLLGSVAVCAVSGMFAGTALARKIPGEKLKPAFGWFVLLMGIYILTREAFFTA
jgi:uncharacterized membrane protein YfcA